MALDDQNRYEGMYGTAPPGTVRKVVVVLDGGTPIKFTAPHNHTPLYSSEPRDSLCFQTSNGHTVVVNWNKVRHYVLVDTEDVDDGVKEEGLHTAPE
jgi:hypothetical protein